MSCNCHQNQTPAEVFDFIRKTKLDVYATENPAKGVGVFFVPAPESGVLEIKTVFVEGLTYDECVKRGANCFGFQWAPFGFPIRSGKKKISLSSAQDIIGVLDCTTKKCSASGCSMGCYCNSGDTGNCKKNNLMETHRA